MRHLRSTVRLATVALACGLTACAEPTAGPGPTPNGAPRLQRPVDEEPGGGGGGGGGTPGPSEYRIATQLYYDGISGWPPRTGNHIFKAYTQYERNVGGTWQRVNASNISIACYVNGAPRDSDSENNASKVDVTFSVGSAVGTQPPRVLVTCQHSVNSGALTATTVWDGR